MKTIKITTIRYYSKISEIEALVDETLTGDDLIDFLTNDDDINDKIENDLSECSLSPDDTTYEFYDEKEQFGGHF